MWNETGRRFGVAENINTPGIEFRNGSIPMNEVNREFHYYCLIYNHKSSFFKGIKIMDG